MSAALARLAYRGLLALSPWQAATSPAYPKYGCLINTSQCGHPVYAICVRPVSANHAPKHWQLCIDGRATGRTGCRQEPRQECTSY